MSLKEKKYYDLDSIKDKYFTKIFHLKNEIGAYIYFNLDTNLPIIQIKELDVNKIKLNDLFSPIVLNANGKYTLNNGLFYSDGIKINDSKFVVILTSENLLNLLICIFDLYNNDKSLRLRYFYLPLEQINIKISVNIRAFNVGNFLGLSLYNSKSNYPGYTLFSFPNYMNNNNYANNTSKYIEIFIDSSSYSFSFQENILIINNIFGGKIEKIKIKYLEDKSNSGVIIKSSNLNSEISVNDELEFNDELIFEPIKSGAFPGKYLLEFNLILKDLDYNVGDSLADVVQYFGDTTKYYQPKTFTGNTLKLIYQVKCYEKCKSCSQLGSESFYFCVDCLDQMPININNGEKCTCSEYINADENEEQNCIEQCDKFIYNKNEYENYCLSSCLFNNEELYLDEENKECYKDCSSNSNGNIYSYLKTCVSQCPKNYSNDKNNKCILDEIKNDEKQTSVNSSTNIANIINSESINNGQEITSNTYTKEVKDFTQITLIIEDILEKIKPIFDFSEKEINISFNISFNESPDVYVYEEPKKRNDFNDFPIFEYINLGMIPSIIKKYIDNNSTLETEQINKNSKISCYSPQTDLDTLISLNPNLTYLNLNECIDKITSQDSSYEISDLLIVVTEYYNLTSKNNINYEIYTKDGKAVANVSICDNTNVEVSTPIEDFETINYYEAEYLSKHGYDIYNKSSSFYYDFCLSVYINKSDLSVDLRRKEIYPKNVSLCKDGCIYNGINYDTKRINCICNTNITIDDNEFIEEVKSNFFIYIIDLINYKIVTCYEKFLVIDNYCYNFGFYIGVFIILSILIFSFFYLCLGKKSIRRQYLKKVPNMEEIKKIELNFNKQNLNSNSKSISETFNVSKSNSSKVSNPDKKNIVGKKKKKRKKKKIKKSKNFSLPKSSGNLHLFGSDKFYNSNNIIIKTNNNNNNKITKKKLSEISRKEEEIDYNELNYEEALEKDQRNIIQIFISLFTLKLQTIQIFFYPKEFTHLSLTLPLYLFDILLDLTINSLLFSDDIISQKYYNNGELLLFTTNLLSISSNVISFFILYLLEKLINQYEVLDIITKEVKDIYKFLILFINLRRCFDFKITIFFFILTILGILCTYYLFIFFAIYKEIQEDLFVNYIVGSLWSLGYTTFMCLFVTVTRKISIIKKIKRLFILSKFVDEKF